MRISDWSSDVCSSDLLAVQVKTLAGFASTASTIIVAISQIDRSFDMEGKPLPNLSNVRLPNPVDLALFTKTCFLHNGEMQRSEEHTSELQSLMRISYAVFCLKTKKTTKIQNLK